MFQNVCTCFASILWILDDSVSIQCWLSLSIGSSDKNLMEDEDDRHVDIDIVNMAQIYK